MGIEIISRVTQEPPVSNLVLERASDFKLERDLDPFFTNFFPADEIKGNLAHPGAHPSQMLELVRAVQGIEGKGSQGQNITFLGDVPAVEIEVSRKAEGRRKSHVVQGHQNCRRLEMLRSSPSVPMDSRSSQGLKRKRCLTAESWAADRARGQQVLQQSSKNLDRGGEEEEKKLFTAGPIRNPHKNLRTTRLRAPPEDNDLLRLSLSNSNSTSSPNTDPESSTSSQEAASQSSQRNSRSSACQVHSKSTHDGDDSDMVDAGACSSVTHEFDDLQDKGRCGHSDVAVNCREDCPGDRRKTENTGVDDDRPHTEDVDDQPTISPHSLPLGEVEASIEAHALHVVSLLLKCADATANQNERLALRFLTQLYQCSSMSGDVMQRMAACFADSLAARILSKESPLYSTLSLQPSIDEHLSAFTALYTAAPYFRFAHFTANQAILEAMEGHKVFQIIDLDIMQGFQWPSLIQSLASRPGGPPHLRITGVGTSRFSSIVEETGRRLTDFAASYNVPFEFQSVIEDRIDRLTVDALAPRAGEAIAVNSVLTLHRLLNGTSVENNLNQFLKSVCRTLNPSVVTLVEQEASHNGPSFFARFVAALRYYSAVFDSLDSALPRQSEDRMKIERVFFSQQIKDILVHDEGEPLERHESLDFWQGRMELAGFVQVPHSAYAIIQAKLLVQSYPCEGYRLQEGSGSISLGWQDRQLLTCSTWACSQ